MATARVGETEVYFIDPVPGKCYKYAIETRVHHLPDYSTKHFTTNPLEYAGKFLRREAYGGYGNGADIYHIFKKLNGNELSLKLTYDAPIRYVETPCQVGGKRKHRRGTKKAKRSRRKTRRRHHH